MIHSSIKQEALERAFYLKRLATKSMQIHLKNLVDFYDTNREVRRHSNAIKSLAGEELNIALLTHYLQSQECQVEQLDQPCTAQGKRLDAWIRVIWPHDQATYYQVEVKSWSFHGYGGGTPLPYDAADEEVRNFKMREWSGYWDSHSKCFKDPKLNKVLTQMKQFRNEKVLPLACLWAPMHPDGDDDPFFERECRSDVFSSITIFSASSYVRKLIRAGQEDIQLNLPQAEARIGHLKSIFLT